MSTKPEIIKTKGQSKGSHSEDRVGGNGKKTKIIWKTFDVEYQRAAFELVFSPGYRGGDDDYMLSSNPCWPSSIVPNDPGYALLTDDAWYQGASAEARKYTKSYGVNGPIPQELLAKAGDKRPPSPDSDGSSNKKPPHRKRDEIGPKYLLQVLNDGLAIRDGNNTRRITDEEAKRNIKVTTCQDHACLKERRAVADVSDDTYVVFPGDPPPKEPPINVDTVPTAVARHPRDFPVQKRSEVSPDLPKSTGIEAQRNSHGGNWKWKFGVCRWIGWGQNLQWTAFEVLFSANRFFMDEIQLTFVLDKSWMNWYYGSR